MDSLRKLLTPNWFFNQNCFIISVAGALICSSLILIKCFFPHKPANVLNVPLWSCTSSCLSDEFQNFVRRLPTFYALNISAIQYFWKTEPNILQRYKQLELSTQQLVSKAHRIIHKIFTLSKRCRNQPKIIILRERWGAGAYFLLTCCVTCAWLCREEAKLLQPKVTSQVLSNRLWTAALLISPVNAMCGLLLSLQLGIMLIIPTIYKHSDIQLSFHWSQLQRHTWWLGFTAQIFFTSKKSKLPCCEIKLCRVLKEYAKISFLLGGKSNAKIIDQEGFHHSPSLKKP